MCIEAFKRTGGNLRRYIYKPFGDVEAHYCIDLIETAIVGNKDGIVARYLEAIALARNAEAVIRIVCKGILRQVDVVDSIDRKAVVILHFAQERTLPVSIAMYYLVIKCAFGEYHIVEAHHESVVATELQERKARNIVFGIDL